MTATKTAGAAGAKAVAAVASRNKPVLSTANIISAYSPASTTIEIRVDQMHGTSSGEAVLLAYWWTIQNGAVQSTYQYMHTEKLKRDGYAALANAQEELLAGLAQNIADTLKTTP